LQAHDVKKCDNTSMDGYFSGFCPREDLLLVGRREGREKRGGERKHRTEENTHSQNTSPYLPTHIFLIYSQKCKYKNDTQSTRAGKQAPNPCYLVSKLRRETLNSIRKAPLNTRNDQNLSRLPCRNSSCFRPPPLPFVYENPTIAAPEGSFTVATK
jgi:hypothetical protein